VTRLSPIHRKGLCQWERHVTDTQLGHHTVFFRPHWPSLSWYATRGHRGSRLIVGDAANGDSILTGFFECSWFMRNAIFTFVKGPLLANGGTLVLEAASRGPDAEPCDGESSGTISGTIVVRGQ